VAIFSGIVPDTVVLAVATTTFDRELYSQVRLRLLAGEPQMVWLPADMADVV